MKVLLDGSLPDELAERLSGFNMLTARRMGLEDKGPATIMREARDMKFDAILTASRDYRFPMGSEGWTFGIVVLEISPATLEGYEAQIDRIRDGVLRCKAGETVRVEWPR
ncbi:MAG: hypothetical protein JNM28_11920 [Armatimonadetes bacterium]|nr:hypothetical protein [Armatimonadota bacterium]